MSNDLSQLLSERKNLFLIDAFALIFRSYYALIKGRFQTAKGEPTSVIFGFMKTMLKIIKDFNPNYMVIALESKEKTFRHKLFNQYKANRDAPPEDLKAQIPNLFEIINAFDMPNIEASGYEADDVIATICEKYRNNNDINVFIVSNDKDLLQLVGENIYAIRYMKGMENLELIAKNNVKDVIGVNPDRIMDYLALTGDASDNIPGVKGIGDKTAIKLLSQFGDLKMIYDQVERVSPKGVMTKLKENKDNAMLSYELVKLEKNIPLDIELDKLINRGLSTSKGIELLKRFELNSLLKDEYFIKQSFQTNEPNIKPNIESDKKIDGIKNSNDIKADYILVTNESAFNTLINEIKTNKIVCVDLETDSEDPIKAKIVGVALSYKPLQAYYIPVVHFDENGNNIDCLSENFIKEHLKNILEDKSIKKIAQNAKYEYIALKKEWDIKINPISFDPMIASYVLDPARKSHGMDHLAMEMLNYQTIKYSDIVPKDKKINQVDINQVVKYAGEDADITLRLYEHLKEEITLHNLEKLYYEIDLPLVEVLGDMEMNGVKIDIEHFNKLSQEIKKDLDELQKNIWSEAGLEFNINSTKQLQEILFEKLGLPTSKKTKTGYSTDVSVLEDLSHIHKVPMMLLDYRQLTKLQSGYLEALPKIINPISKRIHTSFNQTVVTTGRLSSTNPNLQNIPIKGEWGKRIRSGFIAEGDNVIISADYSQIELRILAHLSKDKNLIDAFNNDKDLHKQTARVLFGLNSDDDVTDEQRRAAKTINFSVVYGVGAFTLSKRLNISRTQAHEFINDYFNLFRDISVYFEKQKEQASKDGFVSTIFGRKRFIPEIQSKNRNLKAAGERLAINTPIQGTSADIIKIAMCDLSNAIKEKKLKSKLTIQVHDELVFEADKEEANELCSLIKTKMSGAVKLDVPLKVDINYGKNWDEAH